MSSQYPPASQTSSDIVKAIKRSFIGAAPPMYRGEKVVRRTDTNIALKRNTDHWKGDFHRRTRQKSEGFFSSMAQPYEELGETELDTEKLVTDALRDIGGVFGYENDPLLSLRKGKREDGGKTVDHSNKKMLQKESNESTKQCKKEPCATGFDTIKRLLDEAEKKIIFLKAGKPLLDFLQDQEKESSDQMKAKSGENSSRRNLVMETPDHLLKKDSNTDTNTRSKREPDSKARKRFIAKVDSLKSIFCCVLNMRNKELRNRVPLSRETLKLVRKEVTIDGMQPAFARHRISTGQTLQLMNSRVNKLTAGTSVDNSMKLPMPIPTLKASSINVSNEDVGSTGSKYRVNTAETSARSGTGLQIAAKTGLGNSRVDTWENLVSTQPETLGKSSDPAAAKYSKFSALIMNSKIISSILKPRRGALFPNKGNFDLPIWQRVLQEDARKDEIKTSRKPPKEITNKQLEDAEMVLEDAKTAFEKMKSKYSDKLQREIDTRVGYFRQRLNCLDVSIFPEEDLRNMRSKVKDMQKREDFDNVRPTGWYETLCDEQKTLLLENDLEVSSKIKSLAQFSHVELPTISHIRFFLTSVMELPESNLEDWMISRKLVMSNVLLD